MKGNHNLDNLDERNKMIRKSIKPEGAGKFFEEEKTKLV